MVSAGTHEVKFTNLDKVLYPAAGTTKGEVVDYYVAVAPFLLPGVAGRPLTRKRWPSGVAEPAFFAKDLEPGTPSWMPRVQIPHTGGPKFYPLVDSAAGLAWLGQVAALELHVPQWRIDEPGPPQATKPGGRITRFPDRVVFDLDPGPGAGLAECARVALAVRERLGWLGEQIVPVTSGSKGLHLYVPMHEQITSAAASEWARQVAQQMERAMPELVVSKMTKSVRAGRVFFDWSQNNGKKTTIAPYSLRGKDYPTVAAPRTWPEIADPDLAHLDYRQVLRRLADGIDPTADLDGRSALPPLAQAVGETARRKVAVSRGTPTKGAPASPSTSRTPAAGTGRRIAAVASGSPADRSGDWSPMLATSGALTALRGEGAVWRLEGKWDGMRAVADIGGTGLVLRSRTARDITAGYPELANLPDLLGGRQVVLDGEIVAMDKAGRTDFGRLQQRMGLTRPADIERIRRQVPIAYLIFDVLSLDGESLLKQPLDDRRQILESLHVPGPFCIVPPQLTGAPATVLAHTKADGWEGIIAKRADSIYQPGQRSRAWMKIKNELMLEAAIIGWQPGQGRREDTVGSLLLAVPDGDRFRYVGKVGTGFTDKMLHDLTARLTPLRQATPPADVPRPDARTAVWVTPQLVGEVVYSEMTQHGTMRHPRWRGIRDDKKVRSISNS